ncbi:class I SAM-dependent methyltransferase [Aeribacillus sp. FSL K6-2848]|uniref:class I SAM-dependent methyltransferase n=1 Tax=Aeribacillus sp. FSL K6-2848 TaxID=2954612 RepID=UPI0030F7594D
MINIPNIDYGVLYNQISKLRQSQDIDWIIGFLPERTFESIADIGCGSGQFIKSMMQKGKIRKLAVGIEKNPSMINMAQKNLSNYDNVHFYLTDILSNPKIETSFDLITMMSVLHWTYPRENKAFEWIRNHLQFDGVFCFTTYHPLDSINGIGGTDHLVLEALTEVGLPKRFPDKFVPIGTRTRSIDDIYQLL